MTVSSETSKLQYDGDGSNVAFPVPFYFLAEGQLRVVKRLADGTQDILTLNTDYTVTGAGDPNGGEISLTTAPAVGETITIARRVPRTQQVDFQDNDPLPAETLELTVDKLTMITQELAEGLGRAPKLPESTETGEVEFPEPEAGKVPVWDSGGDAKLVNSDANFDDVLDAAQADADAAAQSASEAADSEAAAATSEANAAASEASAAADAAAAEAAAESIIWNDVVYLTVGDSPYAVPSSEKGVLYSVDASGGPVTVELPEISALDLSTQWAIAVKKTDSTSSSVTVTPAAGDEIDGGSQYVVNTAQSGATFIADADPNPDEWTSAAFGVSTGNMTYETFIDGVDFTAGTTTQLTLAVNYGEGRNIEVFFDSAFQGPDGWTLSGTTLTFSDPIPAGTQNVVIHGGTTVAIGDASTVRGQEVVPFVADRSELKALDSSMNALAWLREDGREGMFGFESGDLSAEVTDDPLEGVYIAPDSDATGASGAWVRHVGTHYNVQWFGAKGDSGQTDNQPAIQAAIDLGGRNGFPVRIPSAGAHPNGHRAWYLCNNSLGYHDNSRIYGDGPWSTELRFLNDSNGLQPLDDTEVTSGCDIGGLRLRGNAPTSSSSVVTTALIVRHVRHAEFRDIWAQGFVDGMDVDAGTLGQNNCNFDNIRYAFSDFPNPVNGFPRFLTRLRGIDAKPQANNFTNHLWYAQLSGTRTDYDGDGSTTDFVFDLISSTILWAESGIKVYVTDANGIRQKQVIGAGNDYTLEDQNGDPINPGDTNVQASEVTVKFNSPPTTGTSNIRIIQLDPTAEYCINVQQGDGNYFQGQLGGANVGVHLNNNNVVHLPYVQHCNTVVEITNNARQSEVFIDHQNNNSIDQAYDIGALATRVALNRGSGRAWAESSNTNSHNITSSSYVTVNGQSVNFEALYAIPREIEVDIDSFVEVVSGSRATADYQLQRSDDNGATWTVLQTRRHDSSVGGATSVRDRTSMKFSVTDNDTYEVKTGTVLTLQYRVQARVMNGDEVTVGADSYLRVRDVNPA